ncbi:hypothetical protein CGU36_27940, partial [Pseudomonas fluorescens]
IEKRINGREEAVVKPGDKATIWYRVTNPGVVDFTNVSLVDEVKESNPELKTAIETGLKAQGADQFDLPAGSVRTFEFEVDAPVAPHTNVVHPSVPPATVTNLPVPQTTDYTTYPATTIPGTTIPEETRPELTFPETTFPAT